MIYPVRRVYSITISNDLVRDIKKIPIELFIVWRFTEISDFRLRGV